MSNDTPIPGQPQSRLIVTQPPRDGKRLDAEATRKRAVRQEVYDAVRTNMMTMLQAMAGGFTPEEALDLLQDVVDGLKADLARTRRKVARRDK